LWRVRWDIVDQLDKLKYGLGDRRGGAEQCQGKQGEEWLEASVLFLALLKLGDELFVTSRQE
jgi:hypothetical protein